MVDSGSCTLQRAESVSALAGPHDKVDEFLKRADQALYKAKREGRNRVMLAAA